MPIYNRKPIEEEKPKRYSLFSPREMLPAEGMPELAPMEQEAPKKMSLFSPPAASPDQSPDLGNMVEPKKKGFGTKFKEFFTGQDLPGGTDELGLQKPGTHKEGVGGKILSYLLPFLFASTGAPAAGALAGSYFANKAGKNAGRQDELENYQKQRTLKQKELAPSEYEKNLNTYFNLSPDKRRLADQKAAASKQLVNPLDAAKFGYQQEKDMADREAKLNEKLQERKRLSVPGYELTGDTIPLPGEAEKIRSAVSQFNEFSQGVQRLKDFTDQYGTIELAGEGKAQIDSLTKGLQLSLKELNNLGVLNGPDMMLLQSQLDDINSKKAIYNELTSGGGGAKIKKAALDELTKQLNTRIEARLSGSGYNRVNQPGAMSPRIENTPGAQPSARVRPSTPATPPSNEQSAAIQWAKDNPNDPKAALILKHAGGG